MKYVLALDQGTTSSRAILFDRRGSIRSMAQQEFRQIYPRPGWVEHKPEDLWRSQLRVARRAVSRAGVSAEDVAAIGVANQRETTVVWDRETGKPVGNAIVWQDRRTAARCGQYLEQGHGAELQKKTGLRLDPYFAGTKLQWMLQNIKGLRGRARRGQIAFGTVDSWLLWNLTRGQVHATDAANASRTLLFNIHSGEWDDDLLRLFDIPRSLLPEARSSSEVYGMTNILDRPIPVAGMAGDQQAALFGQTCFRRGMVKNTYGTGCFILMNTGTRPVVSKNNLLTTIAWKIGDRTEYALEGSLFVAGAVVQWLRDELKLVRKAADIEALALKVPDNGGVCFVPAFAGLGAPHWDPYARGLIAGITRGTTPGHLARAALEAIALQSRDVVKAMESDSKIRLRELRVDGGAAANNLLMQIQSDVLNARVVRPRVSETTALGAAYLAGLAVGFWKEPRQLERHWKMDRAFQPGAKPKERARLLKGWEAAVARAKGWEDAE